MKLHTRGWGREALIALGAALGLLAPVGCQDLLNINSDRSVADAVDSGTGDAIGAPDSGAPDTGPAACPGPDAGPWDCLKCPDQAFDPTAMTTVKILAINSLQPITQAEKVDGGSGLDVLAYTALPGLQFRSCSTILTPLCNDGTNSVWETTDDAGVVNFTLQQSFNGFFQIAGPNIFTTSYVPGQFLAGAKSFTIPATILPADVIPSLEQVLGNISLDLDQDGGVNGLGHVVISAFDCFDHFAPNVYFTPSATAPTQSTYQTTIFYTVGMNGMEFPSTNATATDGAGAGGILNVPVGAFSFRVYEKTTGQQVAVVPVLINPGVSTIVDVRPRTH
jgi:hypothetical protein